MTLADYMNPARFPLTTQPGLTAKQQLMIDDFNFNQMSQAVKEEGRTLAGEDLARWNELQEKAEHRGRLLEELKGAG
jgi:hypothetical protein